MGICVTCRTRVCGECTTRVDGINQCVACLARRAGADHRERRQGERPSPPGAAFVSALGLFAALSGLTWLLMETLLPG